MRKEIEEMFTLLKKMCAAKEKEKKKTANMKKTERRKTKEAK